VLAGGVGAFVLTAGSAASATATPQRAEVTAVRHLDAAAHHRRLLGRSDYATIELHRHGQWITLVLDRGQVTAVTSSRITIKRPDGVTVSIALAATTKYRGLSGESAVRSDQRATVVSDNGTALRVSQRTPKATSTTAA
jgi:hypothetical protein